MPISVSLFVVSTPLIVPYVSSLGVTAAIDSVLALVRLDDGRQGCAEVTPIRGYNEETVDQVWESLIGVVPGLVGLQPQAALARLELLASARPYSYSPLAAAIEIALGGLSDVCRGVDQIAEVPIIAPVLSQHVSAVPAEVDALLKAGYTSLKLKAGMDFEADLDRIALVQRCAAQAARIRVDFNGAYDAETAIRFVERIDSRGMELIEQPCASDDWKGNLRVARSTSIPTMLDESIRGIQDIRRAGECGGFRFFKMKLGKFPTPASLDQAYATGEALGMQGVIGNGAATDVACWVEAQVALRHHGPAGEMNGFCKNAEQYLRPALECRAGRIQLCDTTARVPDMQAIQRNAVRAAIYGSNP
jgi:L-alanine-DL-glutamate epimerase-like enolase superfamily enzyme